MPLTYFEEELQNYVVTFGPFADYVYGTVPPEKQEKLQKLDLDHIRYQLLDILATLVKGVPSAVSWTDVSYMNMPSSGQFSYQRQQQAQQGRYAVFYKGTILAELQCRPQLEFTFRPIPSRKPRTRLAQALLLNIVHAYYPYAKVKGVK